MMLEIEVNLEGKWETAAEVRLRGPLEQGARADTSFEYRYDYVDKYLLRTGAYEVSCLFPVNYEILDLDWWPAFLLDLFPQGAVLKYALDKLGLRDDEKHFWTILERFPLAPPGNLRIKNPLFEDVEIDSHQGFSRAEVVAKGKDFLEYMVEHGAPISGTTGAAGASPKFMLAEDLDGRFHAPEALSPKRTKASWLIKFPRGRSRIDREILRAEKLYYDLAQWFGLKTVAGGLTWERDCLFIPRFDRRVESDRIRFYGLESLYSLTNEINFGSRLQHETYVGALQKFCPAPEADILEYLWRDLLNQMVGNTDNHGRNTSLIKMDETVELAPLYDFAPMQFDPEGIVRSADWHSGGDGAGLAGIARFLDENEIVPIARIRGELERKYELAGKLETRMKDLGIPSEFILGTRGDRRRMIEDMDSTVREL